MGSGGSSIVTPTTASSKSSIHTQRGLNMSQEFSGEVKKVKRRISNHEIEDQFLKKLEEIEKKRGRAHTKDQWGEM